MSHVWPWFLMEFPTCSVGCSMLKIRLQDDYRNEAISWTVTNFVDNQPCLDLLEGKPGIFAILNEVSIKYPCLSCTATSKPIDLLSLIPLYCSFEFFRNANWIVPLTLITSTWGLPVSSVGTSICANPEPTALLHHLASSITLNLCFTKWMASWKRTRFDVLSIFGDHHDDDFLANSDSFLIRIMSLKSWWNSYRTLQVRFFDCSFLRTSALWMRLARRKLLFSANSKSVPIRP